MKRLRVGETRVVQHALAYFFCFVFLVPTIWLLLASIKDYYQIMKFPPDIIPKPLVWQNYTAIFRETTNIDFVRYCLNTAFLCTFGILAALITNTLVAYGFSRFKFPGREVIFIILLATMMIPGQLLWIPRYVLFKSLGWIGTYLPLLVPSFIGGNAVFIFLLRQFINGITPEFDDAAEVDGCGSFRTLLYILAPMLRPGLVFIIISEFVGRWNDFLEPMIFLNKEIMYPISLALWGMYAKINNVFLLYNRGEDPTGMFMALCVMTLVPPLVVYIIFQRYFVEGIKMGAIKG